MNSRRDRTQHINRQNQIINFRRTKNRQTPKFIYLPLCVPCALLGIVCRAVWLRLILRERYAVLRMAEPKQKVPLVKLHAQQNIQTMITRSSSAIETP